MTDDHRPTPEIRITGDASAEEVAALVAVLAAASGGDDPPPERDGSRWASHRAALRTSVPHGPGAWRTSARP
ncbi:acyl-CoA carboxylase epsilon subunit [Oryzobacter sp. R7]|uniref:acyl-CoA carboxylase epsilon subunit n=1 Tax=Oryzobacter faecalis TaxID=3388656 RepID=UPI00398D0D48